MYRITLPHILNKIIVKLYKNLNKINTKVLKVQSIVFVANYCTNKYYNIFSFYKEKIMWYISTPLCYFQGVSKTCTSLSYISSYK